MAIDQAKLDEFLGRFVAGDRLGLYKGLAAAGLSTPAELAQDAGRVCPGAHAPGLPLLWRV